MTAIGVNWVRDILTRVIREVSLRRWYLDETKWSQRASHTSQTKDHTVNQETIFEPEEKEVQGGL